MNLDQLGASFEQNRTAILGTAAAAVVGFALYKRKQAAAAPAAPTAGATTGGVYSAGGQTAGMYGANAYDSSASDVYGLVQPQLESLGSQLSDLNGKLNNVPVSAAPKSPIAHALTSPLYNGHYAQVGSGIGEVENDGSLLIFTPDQWKQASSTPGYTYDNLGPTNLPNMWSTAGNIAEENKALTPAPAPAPAKS